MATRTVAAAETRIRRLENMVVDVSGVVACANWACGGALAGPFRAPSILPDLRRLRANGLVPQRRSQKRPRNSSTSLSYAGLPSSQAVSAPAVHDVAFRGTAPGTCVRGFALMVRRRGPARNR